MQDQHARSSLPDRPKLVGAAYHFTDADGYLWVGYAKNWVRFRSRTSDLVDVLALLDGFHSLEAIFTEAHTAAPRLSEQQVITFLEALGRHHLLQAGQPPLATNLEHLVGYLDRHARDLEFYALFEQKTVSRYDYLARIKAATITVIGLGGIGSWLTMSLACMGISDLIGVDGDTVELSNLGRQVLFTPDDIQRPKTTAAQTFFMRFDPDFLFTPQTTRITHPLEVDSLVENSDLVVLTADWPPRRIACWVNQSCIKLGIPALYMSGGLSHVGIGPLVIPGSSSCYECLYLQRSEREEGFDYLDHASQHPGWSAEPTPVISPVAGLAGHMLAWEALCAITGLSDPQSLGQLLRLDTTTMEIHRFPIARHPCCPVCGSFAEHPLTQFEPLADKGEFI